MSDHDPLVEGAACPEFRYDLVPAADRDWLRGRRDALREKVAAVAADLVEAGGILVEVRERLGKKRFAKWRAAETPFSRVKATVLMNVARAFAGMNEIYSFAPSALYLLAFPGVPSAARKNALTRAANGQVITHKLARAILHAHKPLPPADAAARAAEVAANFRRWADENRPPPGGGPKPGPAPAADARDAENWRAFVRLVTRCRVVHVGRSPDGEYTEDLYTVTGYPDADGEPVLAASFTDLAIAVADAMGEGPAKVCAMCGMPKALSQFNRASRSPDGRSRTCRPCDKERARQRDRRNPVGRGDGPPQPGGE